MSVRTICQTMMAKVSRDLVLEDDTVIPAGSEVLVLPETVSECILTPDGTSLAKAWGTISRAGHLHDCYPTKLDSDLNLHVSANNASDTDGLGHGRGFTEDMPFASVEAAIGYACQNYFGPRYACNIMVHGEIPLSGISVLGIPFDKLNIVGTTASDILNLSGCFSVGGGIVDFRNIKINLVGNSSMRALSNIRYARLSFYNATITGGALSGNVIHSSGAAAGFAVIGNCSINVQSAAFCLNADALSVGHVSNNLTISGNYQTVCISNSGANLNFAQNCVLNGNPSGQRFAVTLGAKIISRGKGINFIPGTAAGVCDSSSLYL